MSKKLFFIGQLLAISSSIYHITQADYLFFTIIVIGIIMLFWGIQSILALSLWGKITAEQKEEEEEGNSNSLLMMTYIFMTLILVGFNLLMLSLEDNSHWHFG